MKNTRSRRMLRILSQPPDSVNSVTMESANTNQGILDIIENDVENREAYIPSPVPHGADNIQRDIPEVWEDVFGTSDVLASGQKPLKGDESSTPKPSGDDEVITTSHLYVPENSPKLDQTSPPKPANDETPILSRNNADSIADCYSAEIPSKDSELTPLSPANTNELTPFALEVPSSFENSPALSFGDLPSISSMNIPTPMPSPVNLHKDCHDTFCSIHDYEHWTRSPSITNASSAPNDSSNDERSTPPKKRSKKRVRCKSEWSDVKRKCLKNIGKSYVTKRGKVVNDKTLGKPCACRNQCHKKISHDQRYDCFQKFWCLGSREKQWAFVVKYTKKEPKHRCLNRDVPTNRKFTFKYLLPLSNPISEEFQSETASVCKTMFLNTLSVSGKIIKTAWGKYDGSCIIEEDKRGRHANHNQVVTLPDTVKSVCDHVRSFAPIESHYVRKTSTKLYLDGSLSISKMFQLYKEWFDDSIYSSKAVTDRQYRDIVNKNFNLGFFIPKKDQCDICHVFRHKTDPTDQEKEDYGKHLSNKNAARKLKDLDKREAIRSHGTILTAVFDFQKVLSCPHGQVSVFYYKRKLSCLNFTIFDMGSKRAVCYMWDETVAKRGANEVGSCLLDFIDQNVRKGVKEFRFYSDNCAGQNRNRFVFFLYTYCAKKFNVSIRHRFLEKGHTQNEGDSVHAMIERGAEKKTIYTPEEWRLLVRWAKCTGDPYEVRNMTQNNFFDLKMHVNNKIWSKNTKGDKVSWNSVKEIYVNGSESNKLLYKCDHDEIEYKTVSLCSNTRRSTITTLPNLELAYKQTIGLSKDKHKDLISLVDLGIIPSQYADFFRSLPCSVNDNNDNNCDNEDD